MTPVLSMSLMSRGCARSTNYAKSWPPWGVSLYVARVKCHLWRFFNEDFAKKRRKKGKKYRFQTIKPAIWAYLKHRKVRGLASAETDVANPETLDHERREPVLPLRMEERDRMPKPREDEGPTLPDQSPDT